MIHLSHFRGFEKARLELRPLTVLLGPNSAGKSSFGQALVGLDQIHRSISEPRLDRPEGLDAEAWPVDFGTYETLLTRGTNGEVGIGVDVDHAAGLGSVRYGFGGGVADGLDLSHIRVEDEAVSAAASHAGAPDLQGALNFPIQTTQVAGSAQPSAVAVSAKMVIDLLRRDRSTWQASEETELSIAAFRGLRLVSHSHATGTMHLVKSAAQEELLSSLDGLRYLEPNRFHPQRAYQLRGPVRDTMRSRVGSDGRWTPDVLHASGNVSVETAIPCVLPKSPEEAMALVLKPWERVTATLAAATDTWMRYLDLVHHVNADRGSASLTLRAQLSKDGPERDLTDVGFGISQALPIIVQGLLMPADGLFIVEQPESQLHPHTQANIADFFCSLVKTGRRSLVETHSDAFFRRLRTRIALAPELSDQIAVYFVDGRQDDSCEEPRMVDLTGEREIGWPRRFMIDALEEQRAFLSARAALRDVKAKP
jgi:predicted ATPase